MLFFFLKCRKSDIGDLISSRHTFCPLLFFFFFKVDQRKWKLLSCWQSFRSRAIFHTADKSGGRKRLFISTYSPDLCHKCLFVQKRPICIHTRPTISWWRLKKKQSFFSCSQLLPCWTFPFSTVTLQISFFQFAEIHERRSDGGTSETRCIKVKHAKPFMPTSRTHIKDTGVCFAW